jgi:hypothetical protein
MTRWVIDGSSKASESFPGLERALGGQRVGQRRVSRTLSARPKQRMGALTSSYVLVEVERNLPLLPLEAASDWRRLRTLLRIVPDILSPDRPVVFEASKDRPILFTALAWADVLLTLDRGDFEPLIGKRFYGLEVAAPAAFLTGQRASGRLIVRAD